MQILFIFTYIFFTSIERTSDCENNYIKMKVLLYFITIKMLNRNKQKVRILHLSELVLCYFDLIFDRRVEVIFVNCFRNSKVLMLNKIFIIEMISKMKTID